MIHDPRPLAPVPQEGLDAVAEALLQQTPSNTARLQPTTIGGVDLSTYLYVPEHSIYVAKGRSHLGKNWYQAHEALRKEGAAMLTLKEFIDFLLLLQSGNATDGLGNRIPAAESTAVYNEITEARDPWRGEWLDARFSKLNEIVHINDCHRIVNGELLPQRSEPLETCLMNDCSVDLTSTNWQGLPTRKVASGVYYYYPREDCVVRFGAGTDGAGLNGCVGDPLGSGPAIGVRQKRSAAGAQKN